MPNPFRFRELSPTDPFCDRIEEQEKLLSYAKARANVVLFSPRRYGKTSLVKRVQGQLTKKGYIGVYVDFFGVSSMYDVASRLARAVYRSLHKRESLLEKGKRFLTSFKAFRPVFRASGVGLELTVEPSSANRTPIGLLEDIMQELGDFAEKQGQAMNIVLDEFQEITRLHDSAELEGRLRSHIQQQKISYFFVGSRRGVLLAMFNDRKRPFFQSAIMLPLGPLEEKDAVPFVVEQLAKGGKQCSEKVARSIVRVVDGHPYYIQRLGFEVYEISGKRVNEKHLEPALFNVIQSEKFAYEALLQGLSGSEVRLLKALAVVGANSLFSSEFLSKTGLPIGTIQHAQKKLIERDLIEKDEKGVWKLVDPVFANWLSSL